jgi:putative CRISPR-associated protein (TIGR02620 family)
VICSLPVNLATEVCARGARHFNLLPDLPASRRGREPDAATHAGVDDSRLITPSGSRHPLDSRCPAML